MIRMLIENDVLFAYMNERDRNHEKAEVLFQKIRRNYVLTFFDSHYAATALSRDRIIISMDTAYDDIPNLNRHEPDEVL